jgi:hypothetical protein
VTSTTAEVITDPQAKSMIRPPPIAGGCRGEPHRDPDREEQVVEAPVPARDRRSASDEIPTGAR